ncbi:uncharacterized protein LOC124955237 isoform X1 [Vespa velutina]|uniref:uncharacterized protein LOC124955237 isoform X1 n=1 Tax=Vespa velutina TaxID=202808 RepID=UPI001FB4CA07|nr:uncharacterized protein LOC124955237 isoform X1 [Vespa velutina]XP_047365340.1 uncharacterized protein LOC124955237 isoform X1 [Vespa velutina]XP_047365341.1 uncharacterized protein LOC124955237 isoform X1 [Vespa velutina]XP_047365342.1 uncharacterized protein LOC124955237 isoform X1 [Vespa velutina]XP_047365343.1 uncharacterized protein LOC124955237 isoform X1 [Vespa velutina]XP_047365344.1 uncharacterized protein LOC124955237 isoform X1 [Vespa velutina]XP_047365345.1 uncharacterized prot
MPVTRVPTVFHPDGGGSDVNDEINHSKLSSDQCYKSVLNCDTTITSAITTTVTNNIGTSAAAITTTTTTTTSCSRAIGCAQSRKRNDYAFVTFLRVNMRAAIIGVIGVLVVQFAGTLGISSKGGDIKVEIKMPREAEEGATIELRCEWRLLGGAGLYSVKWYKDEHEFFRYVPDNDPKIQTFPQLGIHLDKRSNSEKSIRLANVRLETSGQYKCEVSTEGPSFASFHKTANLTVIALPERGPEITGLTSHYAVGENVTANCTAWPSIPKADLRWTINGETVPAEYTVQHPPLAPINSKGIPNSLGLRLEVEPRHFGGGLVKIKCIAKVGSHTYEAKRDVLKAYVNNQRLSAGDLRSNRACRNDDRFLYGPLIFSIVLIVVAT